MPMIVLTHAEVATVRGDTVPGVALDPVPLADGVSWVLPLRVLEDPAHAAHHALLASLPSREIEAGEWLASQEEV